MPDLNLLGPQFTICNKSDSLTLRVGVNSSSLFAAQQVPPQVTIINGTGSVEITASQPLGLYREVRHDGYYCSSNFSDLSSYAGITSVAIALGETGNVFRTGLISDNLWSWTPNEAVFIGGVRYTGATQSISSNTTQFVREEWTLDPSDNLPQTEAKINAAQVGIEVL